MAGSSGLTLSGVEARACRFSLVLEVLDMDIRASLQTLFAPDVCLVGSPLVRI